jgi:hypothetical protein
MKSIILFVGFYFSVIAILNAQTLKKYPIGASGCSAYLYCNPGSFDFSLSPDSSKVYAGECIAGDITYDIICVKMKEEIKEMEDAEGVLEQYLDYLKSNFQIVSAAGYGKGHRLKGNEHTRGMIDYWMDKDNNNIKVKGWTDGQFIAVNILISAKEIQEARANAFLDGIVFPVPKNKPLAK